MNNNIVTFGKVISQPEEVIEIVDPMDPTEAVIYIVTNPRYGGWIKIGRTKDPAGRLTHYNNGVPIKEFTMEIVIRLINDMAKPIEKAIKVLFQSKYEYTGQEWFKCNADSARDQMLRLADRFATEINSKDLYELSGAFLRIGSELAYQARLKSGMAAPDLIAKFATWVHTNYKNLNLISTRNKNSDKYLILHLPTYFKSWKDVEDINATNVSFMNIIIADGWVVAHNKLRRIDGRPVRAAIFNTQHENIPPLLVEVYKEIENQRNH